MAGIDRASSRRDVLKISALAGVGTLIGGGPGRAAPKKLTLMHESSFIPPYDAYVKNTLAPAYEKLTGIKVDYDVVSVGSLLTRVTTAAENASGPDLTAIGFNWAFLFDDKFVDVSDIALEIGKESGGWYESAQEAVVVGGKWKAIPFGNIGQLMNWRTDWFKEAGYDKFPDTWDELLEAGIKLKKASHPFGFELGHGFGDNHGWLYPLLWSYGGREVEADGKTIVIDSDETAQAVDFCRKFFKETMFEDCLGWTDVSNNKAFLSEQISCTNNAESILWSAKKDFPEIAKVTDQSENPKGPKGRFHMLNPLCHSVFAHTPDPKAAKDFLRWVNSKPVFEEWFTSQQGYTSGATKYWEEDPVWDVDPVLKPFKDLPNSGRLMGYAGPPSQQAAEAQTKYIIVDMYAKAVQGMAPEDAVKWAHGELAKIYG